MKDKILFNKINTNKNCILYTIGICILFYILNCFTPFYSDDWNYNFIFGTSQPITSINDILISQWTHYNQANGRFIPHFFVQLFDGILGKDFFNIINTLFFACFLFLMTYIVRKDINSTYKSISIISLLIFLFLPGFKNNFLWMSGSCNYLWAAVFLLSFHILLEKNIINKKLYPLLFFYGLICAWTNEALVIGLAAGYFIYYAFHMKELTISRLFLLTGFCLGSIFLVLSPGSIHRALDNSQATVNIVGFIKNIMKYLLAMDSLRITFIFIFFLLLEGMRKKIDIKSFIAKNQIWVIATIVSFIFILLTGHDSAHSRFGIELFSCILLLKLISHYTINIKLIYSCNILVLSLLLYINHFAYLNYQDYKSCIRQIKQTNNEIILNNKIKISPFMNYFIIQNLSHNNEFMNDPWIAKHFGKKSLRFIPEKVYNEIVDENNNLSSFNLKSPYTFYMKELDENKKILSVVFKLNKVNPQDVSILLRPFIQFFERYTLEQVETSAFSIVEINKRKFLFVAKNRMIDNRLNSIDINYQN